MQYDYEHTALEDTLSVWRARRARVFGKWMRIYFWMQIVPFIPAVILAVLGMYSQERAILTLIFKLLALVFCAADVYILYQMGREEDHFKTCAGLSAVAAVVDGLILITGSEALASIWLIPDTVLGIVAVYHLMMGCAQILISVDNELSEKWRRLWKWYLISFVVTMVGTPIITVLLYMVQRAMLSLVLLAVILVASVGALFVSILQLVYLYQTAKTFAPGMSG